MIITGRPHLKIFKTEISLLVWTVPLRDLILSKFSTKYQISKKQNFRLQIALGFPDCGRRSLVRWLSTCTISYQVFCMDMRLSYTPYNKISRDQMQIRKIGWLWWKFFLETSKSKKFPKSSWNEVEKLQKNDDKPPIKHYFKAIRLIRKVF